MSEYSAFDEYTLLQFFEKAEAGVVGNRSHGFLADLCFFIGAFYQLGSFRACIDESRDIGKMRSEMQGPGGGTLVDSAFQRQLEFKHCGGRHAKDMGELERRLLLFEAFSCKPHEESESLMNAARWYIRAIEFGHVYAHVRMGAVLAGLSEEDCRSLVPPHGDVVWHVREACRKGSLYARACLAVTYLSATEATDWLEKGARDGYPLACFHYAFELQKLGLAGQAWRYLEVAADKGIPGACRTMGWILEYGKMGKFDYPGAASWYRKAAELGDLAGACNLANLLAHPEKYGIDNALEEAVKWNHMAAVMNPESLLAAQQGDSESTKIYSLIARNDEWLKARVVSARFEHAAMLGDAFLRVNQPGWRIAYSFRHACRDLSPAP